MILIGYDGSASAKRAIPVAHALLGDRPATVLYVWQPPTEFLAPDWFGALTAPVGPPVAQIEELALQRAQQVTHEGFELALSAGFAATARTEPSRGSVWRTILDVAGELDAEVIAVGERGLSTVQSMLLGSVSNAIVHHADVPVLVIPRANAEEQVRPPGRTSS